MLSSMLMEPRMNADERGSPWLGSARVDADVRDGYFTAPA
jgi:hypothetical protein